MPKEYLNPDNLFPSLQYGFSQVVASTGGKTVYLSGQVAWDEHQRIVGANDLKAQAWQSLMNIERAITAAGGSLSDIVSMRIYIVSSYLDQSRYISEALKAFFPQDSAPATTWIGVPQLANEEFVIEIEAVGVIEET